jgi:hypothetical protein
MRRLPASIYEGRTLRASFHRGDPLLGIRATSSHSDPHDSRDAVTARSSNCAILATNVR